MTKWNLCFGWTCAHIQIRPIKCQLDTTSSILNKAPNLHKGALRLKCGYFLSSSVLYG